MHTFFKGRQNAVKSVLMLVLAIAPPSHAAPAGKDAAGPASLSPPVIAVFPYFCPDPEEAKNLAWAVFAVPDMVRERLLDENRFILVEKTEMEDKASQAALPSDYYTGEKNRLSVARSCGADFYTWGYMLRTVDGIKVFHGLVNASSGRTVHLESASLPDGKELIGAMERSVIAFGELTRQSLPEKIIIPAALPAPGASNGTHHFILSPSIGYLTHPVIFSDLLKPSLTGGIKLSYSAGQRRFMETGIEAGFTILSAYSGQGQNIEIAMIPITASIGLNAPLLDFMKSRLSLAGGASLIFGRVNDEFLNYVRPIAALEGALVFFPESRISPEALCRIFYVVNCYQNQNMFGVEPKLSVRFVF